MADTMSLPVIEGNGFGGANIGAGFIGGLVLGSLWNGNGFGWGGNRGGAVADASLANAIEHVSDQVNQGTISALQQAANSNMFMGNLVNSTGDAIAGAINQGTITGLQSNANLNEKLCCINNNITTQGFEARLQGQSLAAQLAQQHAALSAQIFQENCADRELQREIASQAVRDKLAETQAKVAALETQINLTNQLSAQTQYLISQLKTTTTAAAGA